MIGARESGFASIQWVAGLALALVGLAFVANLVALQFARGALAAAAEGAARRGAVLGGSVEACADRGHDLIVADRGLLGVGLVSEASIECKRDGDQVLAVASAVAPWWLSALPDVRLRLTAAMPLEDDRRLLREGSPPSNGS